MFLILVLAVIAAVFAVRIVIGLLTRPVDTVQMLGIWICNFVAVIALVIFLGLLGMLLFGGSEPDSEGILVMVVSGVVLVVASVLSAWLRRRRLRRTYKEHFAAQRAAYDAVMRDPRNHG
ncbi:MAG: hypothetical protein QM607_00200 [Microbacterium sp.]